MITAASSFPVFIVSNLDAAKAFYTANFGFGIAFENAWYLHLVSDAGIQLGFMLPAQPTQPEIFHPAYDGRGVIFSLEVEDVDAAYADARRQALNVVLTLRSEDWGQRHFCLEDPNGIHLDIVQAIAPSVEYEQGYII
ncbi:MAG: VOC family protein [Desulfobacterales bacterium]|jgi:catechol 2,3-dioxygenase-like lactoylglutathione lyase family enzyme